MQRLTLNKSLIYEGKNTGKTIITKLNISSYL